jgi:hypothetical protein
LLLKKGVNNWPTSAMMSFHSITLLAGFWRPRQRKAFRPMETVLLVFVSFAALAVGVLSAYAACIILFTLARMHAAQQRAEAPASSTAHPVSV